MGNFWIILACLSAVFMGLTSILMKVGVRNTNSHLATAIRTAVACLIVWILVFAFNQISDLSAISTKNWTFLILSGLSTGGAWLFQASALKYGDASKVEPIIKLSTIFTMILAFLILQEEFTEGKAVGMVGILMGTFLMLGVPRQAMQVDVTTLGKAQNSDTAKMHNVAKSEEVATAKVDTLSQVTVENAEIVEEVYVSKQERLVKKLYEFGWIVFAVLSSLFIALTAIFGKLGVQDVPSNVANSIITTIVLVMSVGIVCFKSKTMDFKIDKKSLLFLLLSGVTIGLAWACYFTALKYGDASVVVPIDQLSIVITVIFAWTCLKEKITMSSLAGLILIVISIIMTTVL